ncbi:hypothetical protein HPB48_022245 [Haemaphysalis longicornis]|uniref:Uncharacterized protein n=1 Tax=Haemaphysalis longicornis TaxID=44386 RepID=A0A9J6G995_HAELO|nr:hypothetical protein HPB48_022245 [Haemaphysalis longicornis]
MFAILNDVQTPACLVFDKYGEPRCFTKGTRFSRLTKYRYPEEVDLPRTSSRLKDVDGLGTSVDHYSSSAVESPRKVHLSRVKAVARAYLRSCGGFELSTGLKMGTSGLVSGARHLSGGRGGVGGGVRLGRSSTHLVFQLGIPVAFGIHAMRHVIRGADNAKEKQTKKK